MITGNYNVLMGNPPVLKIKKAGVLF